MQQLSHPVLQTLQRSCRVPSQLHSAAVKSGLLRKSVPQQNVLPILDNLVRALPDYAEHMQSHAEQLFVLEKARENRVARQNAKFSTRGLVGEAWRRLRYASQRIPLDTPLEALPNSYFGLPEAPHAPTPPNGVYLHGDVGCGKSLLMDMIFKCASGVLDSCARVHYHSFMTSVYELLHRYDTLTKRERIERGLYHPLDAVVGTLGRSNSAGSGGGVLCFDEFQVADVADGRLMHGILGRLMQSGTVVCFTANRAPAELNRSQLLASDFIPFLDLLHERCDLVHLHGVDYRAEMCKEGQAERFYFAPYEENQLRSTWQRITNRDWNDVSPVIWPVAYGRHIQVERVCSNAVQMSTAELIEAPVGAVDYRAIVDHVSTIFVTNVVPVFTSDTRNFARRFITLIDVCYENKVRIVMRLEAFNLDEMFSGVVLGGSEAEIAEGLQFESEVAKEGIGADNREVSMSTLYTGEDEAFAFRRAVSRLKEMQTTDFGSRSSLLT